MAAWRIYYGDGSIWSAQDGPPEAVLGYGVQVIVQPDRTPGAGNVGYVMLAGYDWYYWRTDSEEWAGAMGDGSMWDLILHREPIVGICQGRRIPSERYDAILAEAETWALAQALPRKSGFRKDERV